MNEQMKQDLDRQLSPVEWTEADTHAVRLGMQEKGSPRRKLRAGLVLALLLVLMGTAAVAGTQNGLLGLIQRMQYPDLPNEAQSYIQTDDVTLETDDFLVTIPEHYYDGRTLRTTVTVRPKEGRKLLYTYGVASYEPWQKLIQLDKLNVDPNDTRTLQDMFSAFDKVHSVHLNLLCDGLVLQENDIIPAYFTRDFAFDPETCTLTFFLQARFEEFLPQREMELKMTIYENEEGMLVHHQRLLHSMTLTANTQPEVYECTEPVVFPEAGVRIDKLTLKVLPQDIYYTIDYTILEWKESTFRAGEPAIWFDFCRSMPQKGKPIDMLSIGLKGMSYYRQVEGMHFVQTGTFASSEQLNAYYLVARDMGRKIRYEANAFPVHLVDVE